MAKIKKKSTKTILSPEEELRDLTGSATDFYQSYRQPINVAVTLIALVLIVAGVYAFIQEGNESKAGQLITTAYDAYAPAGGVAANYPLALQRFQEVAKQFGGTTTGAIADLYVGNTYFAMGQTEAALKEYEAFTKKHSGKTFLLGIAYQRLGYAYLAAGKRDEAVKAFEKAEAMTGTGAATLELARLYDGSGKIPESMNKYKAISTDLPSTAWASEARTKVPPPDLGQTKKPDQPVPAAK
jgi:tetratricopeptide (TPR) repeat protein